MESDIFTSNSNSNRPDSGEAIYSMVTQNGTANSHSQEQDIAGVMDIAPVPHLVASCLVFLLTIPFVLYNVRFFPVGSTVAVLLGSFLMVATTVLSPDDVYAVIGNHDNMRAMMVLLSVMLLAQYLEREQLMVGMLRRLLTAEQSFETYLVRVCVVTGVLTVMYSADVACVILTPVIIKIWEIQDRPRPELQTLLIAISTCANICSVATIYGSVSTAFIATTCNTANYTTGVPEIINQTKDIDDIYSNDSDMTGGNYSFTDDYSYKHLHFQSSQIPPGFDARLCLLYMGPLVLVGFWINVLFLICHYRIRTYTINKDKLIPESEASVSQQEMRGLTASPKLNGGFTNHRSISSNGANNGHANSSIHQSSSSDEGLFDRPPCLLETIPENDILQITPGGSAQRIDIDTDSMDSSDEEESHSVASTDLSTPSLEYRPSALTITSIQEHHRQIQVQEGAPLDGVLCDDGLKISSRIGLYRALGGVSLIQFLPPTAGMYQMSTTQDLSDNFTPADSRIFHVVLCVVSVATLMLPLASTSKVPFDPAIVCSVAVLVTLTFDAICNRRACTTLLKRVNFSVVIFYGGLLILTRGFITTGLPKWLFGQWQERGLIRMSEKQHDNVVISILSNVATSHKNLVIMCIVALTSTVITPVPVIMLVAMATGCARPLVVHAVWCACVAGNISLFSSVAGVIVSHRSERVAKYRVSYWGYLFYGVPTTVVVICAGVGLLCGLSFIPGYWHPFVI